MYKEYETGLNGGFMGQNYNGLVELVNKQIKELVGIYRDAVKYLDISESEFWVWYTLVAIDGEYTQQDICSMWSLPKQTVNTAISRMRRRKYAILQAIPKTRNRKVIRLTPEGQKLGESIIRPIINAEKRAFEKTSTEYLPLVTGVFGKYIDAIREELNEKK